MLIKKIKLVFIFEMNNVLFKNNNKKL